MKVILICRNFDKNSGQGIYKVAGYLYENLRKYASKKFEIIKRESTNDNPYFFDLVECPKNVLKKNFDVYHFLMPEVSLPLLFSKRIKDRSIVTIHDTILYNMKERRWLSEKYIKIMYSIAKKAKIVITPSEQSKKDLIKFVHIPPEKIQIIPWGIDFNFFKPTMKKIVNKKLTVGYVGGLGKRKNVEWILYLAKHFPTIKFKIAGSGLQLEKLTKIKKELSLKNVEFAGLVLEKNLPEFYGMLDVFVFPSFFEGFGIPLLEAMACEVPYIIGTNAGIGEVFPIYKITNFSELKNLIVKIKEGKIEPLKNQRKWAMKKGFTWKNHVKKLTEVYEKI